MKSVNRSISWPMWLLWIAIAFGGSALYGASLNLAMPGINPLKGALWLIIGAGGGWLAFGPMLWLATGLPKVFLIDACLRTMAWGEAVLVFGAYFNLLESESPEGIGGFWRNIMIVAISNVVMAGYLAWDIKKAGGSAIITLCCWYGVLNGVGGTIFFLSWWWLS